MELELSITHQLEQDEEIKTIKENKNILIQAMQKLQDEIQNLQEEITKAEDNIHEQYELLRKKSLLYNQEMENEISPSLEENGRILEEIKRNLEKLEKRDWTPVKGE